jgi:hypothetical protein
VTTLPDDYLVRRLGDHWVVVGPTGCFVVGRAVEEDSGAPERAAELAVLFRTRLADAVPWVPYVDVVLVGDPERSHPVCTYVEPDLLETVLTNGPAVLDGVALHQLRHHLPGVVQTLELESAPLR